MYVCMCRGVTDGEIKKAVHNGISSLEALSEALGVSGECGQCAGVAGECINEALLEISESALYSEAV